MGERICARLTQVFAPQQLEVIDEGRLHIGHAGEGSGHFRVRIVSVAFTGKSSIENHRLIYAALDDLMGRGIHALAIEARTPEDQWSANEH